ncbi:hypothetical protein CR513_33918, partial [Mucuna pruriens]
TTTHQTSKDYSKPQTHIRLVSRQTLPTKNFFKLLLVMRPSKIVFPCPSSSLDARPWQFDRKVSHDEITNRFSFVHMEQKVTLKPMSPRKVCED